MVNYYVFLIYNEKKLATNIKKIFFYCDNNHFFEKVISNFADFLT